MFFSFLNTGFVLGLSLFRARHPNEFAVDAQATDTDAKVFDTYALVSSAVARTFGGVSLLPFADAIVIDTDAMPFGVVPHLPDADAIEPDIHAKLFDAVFNLADTDA